MNEKYFQRSNFISTKSIFFFYKINKLQVLKEKSFSFPSLKKTAFVFDKNFFFFPFKSTWGTWIQISDKIPIGFLFLWTSSFMFDGQSTFFYFFNDTKSLWQLEFFFHWVDWVMNFQMNKRFIFIVAVINVLDKVQSDQILIQHSRNIFSIDNLHYWRNFDLRYFHPHWVHRNCLMVHYRNNHQS